MVGLLAATALAPATALAGRYETVSQSMIRFHGAAKARTVRPPLALPVSTPRAEPELETRAEPELETRAGPERETRPEPGLDRSAEPEVAKEAEREVAKGSGATPAGTDVAAAQPSEPSPARNVTDAGAMPEASLDDDPNADEVAPMLEPTEKAEARRRRELRLERTRAHKRQLGEAVRNVEE